MAAELSNVLDHIEKIRELDLDGVPPTSHVVDVINVLRADEPRPCLPLEVVLEQAPEPVDPGGHGFRRPEPGRADDRADRAVRRRGGRGVRAGEIDAGELFDAYRERAAAERPERVHVGGGRAAGDGAGDGAPLGGVPLAVKDLFCTEGVPSQAGSRILEGYRPPYTATVVAKLARRRRAAARQDQPGRVRDGLLERELGLRSGAQPVGSRPRPGRLLGRQRRGRRRRPRAVGDRHRHGRLDPPARGAVRDRRPEADLRRVLALRDDRVRVLARPGRSADPRRDRRRAAAAAHGRARRVRLDVARVPRGDRDCRPPRTSTGLRLGVPEELAGTEGGVEPGVRERFDADAQARRAARARPSSRAGFHTRRTRCRPTT